jgi:twitching motility protein PilU
LFRAYKEGVIDEENALAHADSRNDLRLMIKLDADDGEVLAAAPDLSIAEDEDQGQHTTFAR